MLRTLLLLVAITGPAAAAPDGFRAGVAALEAGDAATAVEHWVPLAEDGDRDAQFNLGIVLAHGIGVAADPDEAVEWLARAAAQGDQVAAYNLGVIHSEGQLVAQDYAAAARWYGEAARAQHPAAILDLAMLYANGRGVEQDVARAARMSQVAEELECLFEDATGNFEPRSARLAP